MKKESQISRKFSSLHQNLVYCLVLSGQPILKDIQ